MEYIIILTLFSVACGYYLWKEGKADREKKRVKEQRQRDTDREEFRAREYAKQNQDLLAREIEALVDALIRDWNSAIYSDKIRTLEDQIVTYRFENGDTIWYRQGVLKYDTRTKYVEYTIGYTYRIRFTATFNRMVEIINAGNVGRRSSRRAYSTTSSTKMQDTPNRKYNVLMETIRLRKEGLAKIPKTHPDYTSLLNELRAAERVAASIKN